MSDTTEIPTSRLAKVTVRVEIVDQEGVTSELSYALNPNSFRCSQNRSVEPQYGAGKVGPTSLKTGPWDISITGQQLEDS